MITVQEAIEEIKKLAKVYGEEYITLEEALGRVLAEEIHSDRDYPPFNRATMDGIAIRAEDIQLRNIREFEVAGEIFAGSPSAIKLASGNCIKIMTGAPVPADANAVVRIEDTEELDNKIIVTADSVDAFQNIALRGEDLKQGESIMKKGALITAAEISLLAVVGKAKIKVFKNPTLAVISTGNEIKPIDDFISSHQIRDSNSYAIQAFFKKQGISISLKKLVMDNKENLTKAIKEALNYDIVVTSGGVSMGEADFLPEIFDKLGVEKVFHKVQVKPGKPLWFGQTKTSVVFGLPGNPVSVQVACKVFIKPYLRASFGLKSSLSLKLPMLESRKKKAKFDEFFPCYIQSGDPSGIRAIKFNGSGDISATLGSHGIALHPTNVKDLLDGDSVEFFPW